MGWNRRSGRLGGVSILCFATGLFFLFAACLTFLPIHSVEGGALYSTGAFPVSPLELPSYASDSTALGSTIPITPVLPTNTKMFFPFVGGHPPISTPYLPLVFLPDPLTPINPQPQANATEQSPNAFLTWELLTPTDQPLSYEVWLEANNPTPTQLVAGGLQKRAFDPLTFLMDTQYYWQVVAIDAAGRRIEGPTWTFHVEPLYDPPLIGTMVLVPAGEFSMGCDSTVDSCTLSREVPLHRVYLDAFEIDKYEVTNMEYKACVDANVCNPPRRLNSLRHPSYFGNPTFDYYPVMYVSWYDAQDYCARLGKRLPTEAEWEKAARGSIDTRPWPWGTDGVDCTRANYYVHCGATVRRIGSYPTGASPYGAMDMSGNVFEWVQDKFDVTYYTYSPYANPQGPELSRMEPWADPIRPPLYYYSIRGGSYTDNWWYARVTHRHWGHHGDWPNGDSPLFRSYRVGFRCARTVSD